MKTYKSKVDSRIVLIVVVVMVVSTVPCMFVPGAVWHVLAVDMVVWLIFADMVFNTEYIIDGQMLRVKCGMLAKDRCDIMSVIAIRPTHNLASSPAMSLDRIEIMLKGRSIIISPKDKEGFVNDMCKVNPDIKVLG